MKLKAAVLALLCLSFVSVSHAQIPEASGTLIFDDEFNGTAINTNAWTIVNNRVGPQSQAEEECYLSSQVAVTGGSLVITAAAVPNPATNVCGDSGGPSGPVLHSGLSEPYVTGEIFSSPFSFEYGAVEYRAAFPLASEGTWPAAWMKLASCAATEAYTGENYGPNCPDFTGDYTETDMTECFPSHYCGFGVFNPSQECYVNAEPLSDTNMHVYDLVWVPGLLTMYMDGTEVESCSQSVAQPQFLIFLIQIAAGMGTPPANLSTTLSVDYIRVFENQYTTFSGSAPPAPSISSQNVTVNGTSLVSAILTYSDNSTKDITSLTTLTQYTPPPPTLTINPANFPSGTVGVAYSGSVSAAGGKPPYTFTATGLEANLSMNSSGSVSGTPTIAETDSGTVKVTDSASATASESYSFVISPASGGKLTLGGCTTSNCEASTTLPNATLHAAYSFQLPVNGGTSPYRLFVQQGSLPSGIALSGTGLLSGTPTAYAPGGASGIAVPFYVYCSDSGSNNLQMIQFWLTVN